MIFQEFKKHKKYFDIYCRYGMQPSIATVGSHSMFHHFLFLRLFLMPIIIPLISKKEAPMMANSDGTVWITSTCDKRKLLLLNINYTTEYYDQHINEMYSMPCSKLVQCLQMFYTKRWKMDFKQYDIIIYKS